MSALLLLAALHAAAAQLTADHPWGVAPGSLQSLSTAAGAQWSVSSALHGISVPATVPGDLVSDLQRAAVIGDPFYELGFLNTTTPGSQGAPVWDTGNWTFATAFIVQPSLAAALAANATPFLVFDGIKMAADISLNGVALGAAYDQFLRYSFELPPGALLPGTNSLVCTFGTSRDPRNAEGRFSGASGGWDWGPYTATNTNAREVEGHFQGTFSKGLWRDVYLAAASPALPAIEHVAPYVFYEGAYPTAPLTDASAGPWRVVVKVQLRTPAAAQAAAPGRLRLTSTFGAENSTQSMVLPPNCAASCTVELSLTVAVGGVALWWPNGMGAQALHGVTATWEPDSGSGSVASQRPLGFRHFAIVTGDDTAPAALAGRDGSGNLTVRWKVNGANLWARGADIIPLEVLDGRSSDAAVRALLHSAAAAHMNTIRVDGIDLYFPDILYDTADQLGLMVYQDMQYSQGNPSPVANAMQTAEIVHSVRRLAYHPSVVVYDGCNECGGHGIYSDFVMTTVAAEDASRPPWPSSPSNGWTSGVDALSSLPNGSPLGLQPTLSSSSLSSSSSSLGEGAATGAAAALARAAAQSRSTAGGCTFYVNLDLCPEDPVCRGEPHPSVASPSECCAACTAAGAAACGASVFYQGQCWLKPPGGAGAPVVSPGRVLCLQPGAPPPPAPSVGPMPTPGAREQHGPYEHGSGFPAVNGMPKYQNISHGPIPPVFSPPYLIGPAQPSFAVSEFGCPSASSFESYAPTLQRQHWSLHGGAPPDVCPGGFARNCTSPATGLPGNVMAQRNYPMDSIVGFYFGMDVVASFDGVGEAAFQRQLYFALLAPALQIRSHIEFFRSSPSFMTLFWQLAELWPTNGWGSLEYGTASGLTGGQVVGGRWKPLHYWLTNTLYLDYYAGCDATGLCLVRNDNPFDSLAATLTVSAVSIATGLPMGAPLLVLPVALPPGAGAVAWACLSNSSSAGIFDCGGASATGAALAGVGCAASGVDCVLRSQLRQGAGGGEAALLLENVQLWALPSVLALAGGVSVTATVGAPPTPAGAVPITLHVSGGAAVLVCLTTAAQGRFSDNALLLVPAGDTVVQFVAMVPGGEVDAALLASSLRVEHYAMYRSGGGGVCVQGECVQGDRKRGRGAGRARALRKISFVRT